MNKLKKILPTLIFNIVETLIIFMCGIALNLEIKYILVIMLTFMISRGRYRGPEEKMHEIMEHYGDYTMASDAVSRGNYGAEEDSVKSLDSMLKCVCIFMDMLEENADSPEEAQIIKKYRKKMSE